MGGGHGDIGGGDGGGGSERGSSQTKASRLLQFQSFHLNLWLGLFQMNMQNSCPGLLGLPPLLGSPGAQLSQFPCLLRMPRLPRPAYGCQYQLSRLELSERLLPLRRYAGAPLCGEGRRIVNVRIRNRQASGQDYERMLRLLLTHRVKRVVHVEARGAQPRATCVGVGAMYDML